MSLQPLKRKKNISEIKAGTHLLCISDMSLLKFPDGKVQKVQGFPVIVVQFRNGQNEVHEQNYIMDNDFKQKSFDNMLRAAQVPMANGTPKKADAVGKRLYAGIKELHYVEDDVHAKTPDGEDWVEYYIFKVYPFIEGGSPPKILGDPAKNNGIASHDFVTYKNIAKQEYLDVVAPYKQQEDVDLPDSLRAAEKEEAKKHMASFAKPVVAPEPIEETPSFEEEVQAEAEVIEAKEINDNEIPDF